VSLHWEPASRVDGSTGPVSEVPVSEGDRSRERPSPDEPSGVEASPDEESPDEESPDEESREDVSRDESSGAASSGVWDCGLGAGSWGRSGACSPVTGEYDVPESVAGSATATHGAAMTALVVADTPASRRPEVRVTRRNGRRGGMARSSFGYEVVTCGVGGMPATGFQPAARNRSVPGRATSGTGGGAGSGMFTQSPRPEPRTSGCQAMSRVIA
jgi:hypothetical protein